MKVQPVLKIDVIVDLGVLKFDMMPLYVIFL